MISADDVEKLIDEIPGVKPGCEVIDLQERVISALRELVSDRDRLQDELDELKGPGDHLSP